MRTTVKVGSRGRVTIPAAIRRQLGVGRGGLVEFVIEDGVAIVRPAGEPVSPFEEYPGVLGSFKDLSRVIGWQRSLRDED
jgi:AbrB family looped-hinge helix DNA binding protein